MAFIATVALCVLVWIWQRCPSDPGTILRVECSYEQGNVTDDHSWKLDLDSTGNGTLTVDPGFHEKRLPLSAPHRIAELQNAVDENRLCALPSQIGGRVVDSSSRRMKIQTTTFEKTITMDYVQPRDVNNDVLYARRLWDVIRASVDDAKAGK